MSGSRLGFIQCGQLCLYAAQLQLLLLQRLGIGKPLRLPDLQQLQLPLCLLLLAQCQTTLYLSLPDIQIAMYHIGNQGYPRRVQLSLCIQHTSIG